MHWIIPTLPNWLIWNSIQGHILWGIGTFMAITCCMVTKCFMVTLWSHIILSQHLMSLKGAELWVGVLVSDCEEIVYLLGKVTPGYILGSGETASSISNDPLFSSTYHTFSCTCSVGIAKTILSWCMIML